MIVSRSSDTTNVTAVEQQSKTSTTVASQPHDESESQSANVTHMPRPSTLLYYLVVISIPILIAYCVVSKKYVRG